MIPRRFFLFWSADKLSYLRFLCLKSIRHFHPDWQIDLFLQRPKDAEKTWLGDGKQDFHVYEGKDYLPFLKDLRINVIPVEGELSRLLDDKAPVHSSDIFRFQELHKNGGIYVDTDTLFTGPIDDLYDVVKDKDAVITYSVAQGFQIGFLAASPGSEFFKELLASSHGGFKPEHYQSCGTDALYLLLDPGCDPHNSFRLLSARYDQVLVDRFPNSCIVPSETLYPYNCDVIPSIFEGEDREIPQYCVHLFGGHPLFQEYNSKLTPDNAHEFDGFVFWVIREIGLV